MFATRPLTDSSLVRHDAAALGQAAAARGYLFFRRLIDQGAVQELRRQVLEVCREFGWLAEGAPLMDGVHRPGIRLGAYDDRWVEFQRRVVVLPAFMAVGEHPAILGVLGRLFGGPAEGGCGQTCRVLSPGAPEFTTPPHQDRFYVRAAGDFWTVWIPLGDCPAPNGGLAVLPGSQRRGLLPHRGEGPGRQGVAVAADAVWATCDYAAGDVVMFHGLTIHRACDNTSRDRLRLSADFRFQPAGAAGRPGAGASGAAPTRAAPPALGR
jgi:ectoine hydroxylase-related dioxygenase (phytanoyl-CoA dioxygenase family)